MNTWKPLAALLLCLCMVTPLPAKDLYVSLELGNNYGGSLDADAKDNDRASICDEYINPNYAATTVNGVPRDCTGERTGDAWSADFDSDEGVLFGLAVGYRVGIPWRVEFEYFYRDTEYDETADVPLGGPSQTAEKLEREITTATMTVDSMTSHNLFANLYYDFTNSSRFTPYVGIGAGLAFTEVEHESVWARNDDPERITSIPEGIDSTPGTAAIRASLAGTATREDVRLDDTLFGWQVMAGVDYALSDTLLAGIKVRMAEFATFSDGDDWDQLRSHPSNLRRDGSEPVAYRLKLDDIELVGVSVNLKYLF